VDTPHLIDHLFRTRAGQMVSSLTRIFGAEHLELVEDVVQEALLKAVQQWPFQGVPDNPAGWLFQVARNKALDVVRQQAWVRERSDRIREELISWSEHRQEDEAALADDQLCMILMCCHPMLSPDTRVALSLKTVGGFGVDEIARAFVQERAAVAQRLVRAKRQLRDAGVRIELPAAGELPERLESVLEVVYLLFNEGYVASRGSELLRLDMCREAIRLGRLIAADPRTTSPAVHALLALMLLQSARFAARVDAEGDLLVLGEQDRSRWDRRMIAAGYQHFERSIAGDHVTRYHIEAAIAAVHARATSPEDTDWAEILRHYDMLAAVAPSPIVSLNRAVAIAQVRGAAAALESLRDVPTPDRVRHYHHWHVVHGELLRQQGDLAGASRALRVALALVTNPAERRLLERRLADIERQIAS
jgi:RNA polymerase sigma-70 factor (ECF subfamily)